MNAETLMLKGLLSEFPQDHRDRIDACAAELRETIASANAEQDWAGHLAMAVVGMEMQDE